MQLQRGTQSQGYASKITIKGVQYQSTPTGKPYNRATYNFDNFSEWQTGLVATGNQVAPTTQIGTEIYQGVNDSYVDLTTFKNYNPLTVVTRSSTKPGYLTPSQYLVKTVNEDYSQRPETKFTFKGSQANDKVLIRYYIGAGVADYYQAELTAPIPDAAYTFSFKQFVPATYGIAITPINQGVKKYASGLAIVTKVGNPTGQVVRAVQVLAAGTTGSKITPIAFEGVNNFFGNYGTKFQIDACCVKEITDKLNRKYVDLNCGEDKSGSYLDSQEESIKFVVQKSNILLRATGFGAEVYEAPLDVPVAAIKLNITTTGVNIVAIPSGDIRMTASDTNVDYISIDKGGDCLTLTRDYVKNTSATLDPNCYYLDLVNNQIVLSNEVLSYGEVRVYTRTTKLATIFDHYTKQNPTKVILEWYWTNVASNQTYLRRVIAELGYPKDKVAKNGNETEFDCDVILTDYDQSIEAVYSN